MSDKTEAAFSIEFDEEGGTVPGVTQLLNPKAIMEKAARDKAKGMPSTPPPILAKPSVSLEPTKTHAVLPDFEGTSPATMPGVNELLKPIEFKAKPLKKITSLEKTAFHEVPSFAEKTSLHVIPQNADKTQLLEKSSINLVQALSEKTKVTTSRQIGNEIAIDLGGGDEAFAQLTTQVTAQTKPMTSLASPKASGSLASLGVQYELVFEKQQNHFRYCGMKPHAKATFELWQEQFYSKMKLDLRALGVQVSFQEFSKKQNPFHEDAFGMTDANYVQVVRVESEVEKIFVLLSAESLLLKQEEVRVLLAEIKSMNGGDGDASGEFKVEMAS